MRSMPTTASRRLLLGSIGIVLVCAQLYRALRSCSAWRAVAPVPCARDACERSILTRMHAPEGAAKASDPRLGAGWGSNATLI